ncbi:hypothetical protein [Microbacterium sp. nov. GSS16]|uniref:hypothetical protein n=1 Tax=Microbacterium sp. nov. GSS16 TaxID=3019890 RepID=UPI002305A80E|nr:hypothetical protein [Microbacterium sp. nov. GSS16]WCD93279.1 hypothetical protein PGB26_03075 [Microbacterium sp. nov. GSS16]
MDAHNYREDRTSLEIDRLLHHDFVIPISRGITSKFVEENYQGWTWNELIRVLNAARVRVPRPGGPSTCHGDVVRVQFDSEQSWRVEWKDGSVTEGPEPAGTTDSTPSTRIETGVHDLSTGMVVELPGTPEAIIAGTSRVAPESERWPADEHPIFIDAGFGSVRPSSLIVDGLGQPRRLTSGAIVRADADVDEFAREWRDILAEKPTKADRWEYAVDEPRPEGDSRRSGPIPITDALERVRTTPGAQLQRRAVGRWRTVPTPFPSVEKTGWADLESAKREWHAAMNEFSPSHRGSISRMGGIDAVPTAWIEFARRAAAVGFSPSDYRMLGTAHLAWTARQTKPTTMSPREIPALGSIEFWACFPPLLDEGFSPLQAIEQIIRTQ